MDRNLNKLGFIGLGVTVVGLFLSFVLILEYYGSAGAVGAGLCGAVGDASSCEQVAESSYSSIRGIPGLGDIPVALLGFAFYGALSFGFFKLGTAKDSEEYRSTLNLLFPFLMLGLVADVALLLVSIFLIQALCSMCVMTYLVTIALFGIVLLARMRTLEVEGESLMIGLKKNLINYAIAFLAFFSVGLVLSKSVSPGSDSLGGSSTEIQKAIEAFDAQGSFQIDSEGSASIGSKDAPIVIVKYADFNCRHCMHASHILTQMLSDFDGMIRVVYMNFPLDGSCNRLVGQQAPGASSCVAATASLCGNKQGKFAPVYKGLYADNENGVMHSTTSVMNVASKAGLDMTAFRSCMGSPAVQKQLMKEVDEAEKLNIQSTPSIYINGKPLPPGTPDPSFLKKLLMHLVEKA